MPELSSITIKNKRGQEIGRIRVSNRTCPSEVHVKIVPNKKVVLHIHESPALGFRITAWLMKDPKDPLLLGAMQIDDEAIEEAIHNKEKETEGDIR